jgi:hypothetical protein
VRDQRVLRDLALERAVVHRGNAQPAVRKLPGPAAWRRAEIDGAHAGVHQI